MKRTEITYKKTPSGFIQIISIKNCATKKETAEEFGYDVAGEYFSSQSNYYRSSPNSICVNGLFVYENDMLTSMSFDSLIKVMKNAGSRLMKIVKKETKVKTILI